MKGIDPELEAERDEALHRIVSGAADFTPDADGFDSIVVGQSAGGRTRTCTRAITSR